MLGYQHLYHAGNRADVHKHAAVAWMLDYLTHKDKPLSYLETHAGRGLYDLSAPEARRTGEAAAGIALAEARGWFAPDHPYRRALAQVRAGHGPSAYPGSPALAAALLRPGDRIQLAERHPAEHAALQAALGGRADLRIVEGCGLAMARALCPPQPRRGLMLVDPSYEGAADYAAMAPFLAAIHRRWAVGVLVLWYPILTQSPHAAMLAALERGFPDALRHEVRFAPARPGHRMIGSGLFVVNPPWGLADEGARLSTLFAGLV
ncbi:23S rRNA (adenine(2030)-N(6))-methyltransferase RlmJ [Rhodobaculum claviforme]|uniref:Ribosomal RNA large subunit methyltransferase J n=1 Tax=Rhodobaculum claviforme TaxID=1549854 RepID=A0A934TLV2_9RHOB|nr:23S rRNA (adenine(2030)-N(6))-methyltransferase RlmJ [Rhodobaculum claviforme]MBK5927537.1 23S rRNA (adenine(2030)-N(6))-methyltransferase RlmJ [Rhodobaculum claviforme]